MSSSGPTCTELKVIVDDMFPYISVQEKDNRTVISGYMGELWTIMEEALNFKNKFIKTQFKEGKDMLINGSVDVILIPVVVTTSDVHEFDFSVPVAKSWYELYTKRNGNGATSVSFIETWDSHLWLAFLLTIFTLSTILWIMLKIRIRYGLDKNEANKETLRSGDERSSIMNAHNATFGSCFLTVLGTITSQGFNINTQSTSLRIMMLVILFFGLLMLNSYSAFLVSRLAVDKEDVPFPTLESIIDKKTHTLCVREQSYAYRLFKENESDTELLPIWEPIVNQPPCTNISTVQDIASALCDENTVVLETPHIVTSILESQSCSISRMPGRYASAYTSLLMRKRFKFKKKINELLQKLLTSGIIDYLQKKWLSRRIPRTVNISTNNPVTINHINGVLLVYAFAILASLAVLFLQKVTARWKTCRRNKISFGYIN